MGGLGRPAPAASGAPAKIALNIDKASDSTSPAPVTQGGEILRATCADYLDAGWALVPIGPDPSTGGPTKGPTGKGWNRRDRCVTETAQLSRITYSVGLAHAYSGTCAVDLDDLAACHEYLKAQGIDLDAIYNAPDAVRIVRGHPNRGKLLYRLPAGVEPLRSVKPVSKLEFRCASADGLTVQDVLPPSRHPDGGPYTWDYADDMVGDWRLLPELPAAILTLWRRLIDQRTAAADIGEVVIPDKLPRLADLPLPDETVAFLDRGTPITDDRSRDLQGVVVALYGATAGPNPGDLRDDVVLGLLVRSPHVMKIALDHRQGKRGKAIQYLKKHLADARPKAWNPAWDFESMPAESAADANARNPFRVIPAAEFAAGRSPSWIVKDVLPAAELAVIFGESGSGKSFFALDLVAAVARGIAWRNHRTTPGRVVIVAAEGAGGFRKRLAAYATHHGVDLAELPVGVVPAAPSLLKDDDRPLAAAIEASGGASVIVVDTLAQATAGANENSGEDMGKVLGHCRRLHAATGALVVLIHHSGKDASKGARGWSGVRAACDAEIEVTRLGLGRTATVTKQKDGSDGEAFHFQLDQVAVGTDEDGETTFSCVVQYQAAPPPVVREPRGVWEKAVWRAAQSLAGFGDDLSVEVIVDNAVQCVPHDPKANGRDRRRESAKRAITTLADGGFLRVENDKIVLPHDPHGTT